MDNNDNIILVSAIDKKLNLITEHEYEKSKKEYYHNNYVKHRETFIKCSKDWTKKNKQRVKNNHRKYYHLVLKKKPEFKRKQKEYQTEYRQIAKQKRDEQFLEDVIFLQGIFDTLDTLSKKRIKNMFKTKYNKQLKT